MFRIKFLATTVLVSIFLIHTIYGGDPQEIYIYDEATEADSNFFISTKNSEPDLLAYNSLNMTSTSSHLVCRIGGWTFYTGINYTGDGSYFPYSESLQCANVLPGQKSTRFAGLADDAQAATLSFYAEPNFIGQQWVITQDTPNISYSFASIYKTNSTAWTIYTAVDYTGFSFCVQSDATLNLDSVTGSIRSARMGCFSNDIL